MLTQRILVQMALVASLTLAGQALAEDVRPKVTREQVQKEVSEAIEAVKAYSIQKREAALAKAKVALDKLDRDIEAQEDALRENWSSMTEEARRKSAEANQDLRRRRQDMAEWYGAMKHASKNAWGDIKQGFAGAYEKLKGAWRKAHTTP